MQIICEFCGHAIDTDKEELCENCGASYQDNHSYIELKKFNINGKRRKVNETIKQDAPVIVDHNNRQIVRKIVLGYIIFILAVTLISGLVETITFVKEIHDDFSAINQDYVTGDIHVDADNGVYAFGVINARKTTVMNMTPREGHMFVRFSIRVKNTSNSIKNLWQDNISCCADYREVQLVSFECDEIKQGMLNPRNWANGVLVFEVPERFDIITLQYGNTIISIYPDDITYV